MKAVMDEWEKLRKVGPCGCWDESEVEEAAVVRERVRKNGEKAHFGRLFETCPRSEDRRGRR